MYETIPLNVTEQANHRVFVGVGWDPRSNFSILDEIKHLIKRKPLHHDIDLACYIYDDAQNLLGVVSADPEHAANESGKIYHSGDNQEGLGDGDDEQISVELKDLDENIAQIVFIATIKGGHTFNNVNSPEIRIADGYSGHNLHHVDLSTAPNNENSAFVFAKILKDDSGWQMQRIETFRDMEGDFSQILKSYL